MTTTATLRSPSPAQARAPTQATPHHRLPLAASPVRARRRLADHLHPPSSGGRRRRRSRMRLPLPTRRLRVSGGESAKIDQVSSRKENSAKQENGPIRGAPPKATDARRYLSARGARHRTGKRVAAGACVAYCVELKQVGRICCVVGAQIGPVVRAPPTTTTTKRMRR